MKGGGPKFYVWCFCFVHSELFPGQTRLTARPKLRVFAKKRVRKVRSFSNSEFFFLHRQCLRVVFFTYLSTVRTFDCAVENTVGILECPRLGPFCCKIILVLFRVLVISSTTNSTKIVPETSKKNGVFGGGFRYYSWHYLWYYFFDVIGAFPYLICVCESQTQICDLWFVTT